MKTHKSSLCDKACIFDEAFITSAVRYKDSDSIVRLFSKNYGRINLFYARGFRVSKNNSVIQSPSFANISFIEQENNLSKLLSYEIDAQSLYFCASPNNFSLVCYMAELIELLFAIEQKSIKIYEHIKEILFMFANNLNQEVFIRSFELKLLQELGYLPDFSSAHDTVCYEPINGIFSDVMLENTISFSQEAIEIAKILLTNSVKDLPENIDKEILIMIAKIFHIRLRQIHQKPLKSVMFLKDMNSHKFLIK